MMDKLDARITIRLPGNLKKELEERARSIDRSLNWMLLQELKELSKKSPKSKKRTR